MSRTFDVAAVIGSIRKDSINRKLALAVAELAPPSLKVSLVELGSLPLYNPDLESSHFFVPGLVGIILQLVTLFLTSVAVVRERELGTLEQLFVTPVGRSGLLLGKLVPYSLVGMFEMLIVLTVMTAVFHVPIQGNLFLLVALSCLFIVCALGLGLPLIAVPILALTMPVPKALAYRADVLVLP